MYCGNVSKNILFVDLKNSLTSQHPPLALKPFGVTLTSITEKLCCSVMYIFSLTRDEDTALCVFNLSLFGIFGTSGLISSFVLFRKTKGYSVSSRLNELASIAAINENFGPVILRRAVFWPSSSLLDLAVDAAMVASLPYSKTDLMYLLYVVVRMSWFTSLIITISLFRISWWLC